MTGESNWAQRAQTIIEETVFSDQAAHHQRKLSQDIHHAPFLMGIAFAYDACYDAWEPAFRERVADEIARRIEECRTGLIDGKTMSGLNLYVWSNHNAIRVGCIGRCLGDLEGR